jgi:predicted RNase H-like nuclease (RuvC/YqgF family)
MQVTSMADQDFTSWKEIANYLGKGVRTVQRWETQLGLPVQRPNQRDKGIVRASREELDKWIATVWAMRAKDAKSLTEELTILRETIAELTRENTTLKRQLEQMGSHEISTSEPSALRSMFCRVSDDIGVLRRQIAEMRDFTGNIRALNQHIKTPMS